MYKRNGLKKTTKRRDFLLGGDGIKWRWIEKVLSFKGYQISRHFLSQHHVKSELLNSH